MQNLEGMDQDRSTPRRNSFCKWCLILVFVGVVILVLSCLMIVSDNKEQSELKLPHPQYTLSEAALSNATVDAAQNQLTADFAFTLKAYNDPNTNKNKTILYYAGGGGDSNNNSSSAVAVVAVAAQVTVYYLVGVISYGRNQHRQDQEEFASVSSAMVGGNSTLSPLGSAVFTINVHVQNLTLPYQNNDAATGAPNYTMRLYVDYQAGFDTNDYHKVSVSCDGIKCTFPLGCKVDSDTPCTPLP